MFMIAPIIALTVDLAADAVAKGTRRLDLRR